MDPQQLRRSEAYGNGIAAVTAALALVLLRFGRFFAAPALATKKWVELLSLIYPEVERARSQAADLARTFYDTERSAFHPGLPRHNRKLEAYTFQWFVQNMEPVRKRMSQAEAGDDAISAFVAQATREVENAGRRQIIHAVETDDEVKRAVAEAAGRPASERQDAALVKGWARVTTSKDPCAWCLMLASRGPVYDSAETAGLDLPDEIAVKKYFGGDDVSEYFNEWHPHCYCKVIPVFKLESWFGKQEAERALQLWIEASKEADRLIESGESRTNNRNREALNALRRRLRRGDVDTQGLSAFAA